MEPKELSKKETETCADKYIQKIEARSKDGNPYENRLEVIFDVRDELNCNTMSALNIARVIGMKYKRRLEDLDYRVWGRGYEIKNKEINNQKQK